MAQTDEFGEELADFVRRVAELKAARSVPADDLPTVLDAAIFELDHVAGQLWPRYESLSSTGPSGVASVDRQEQQLLKALFQRVPVPVALVDRETVVRRLNFAASSFTGVRAGYATGRPLTGFLAHADRAAFRSQAAAVARGEGDRSLTVHLQQQPAVPVRATLTALRPSGEPAPPSSSSCSPRTAGCRPRTRAGPGTDPDRDDPARGADGPGGRRDHGAAQRSGRRSGRGTGAGGRGAARAVRRLGGGRRGGSGAAFPYDCAGPLRQRGGARDVAAQDPVACPLVVEAARGGSTALPVRPEDPDAFGRDTSGAPILVRANVTSLLCVPLTTAPGPVQGVLTLFRCGARRAFSMAEAQAMDMMSRHLALAMGAPR
ncbi:PAS domain-containing protein [Streptomyces mirabilis]|nr:PAS domain-containing protein [Streptomyces mirabilis]